MEKVYKVNIEFDVVSHHSMNVLAIGNTEKEANENAARQIKSKAEYYVSIGDYQAKTISHRRTGITATMVKVQKKKPPLTSLQIRVIKKLLIGGEQLCFDTIHNGWKYDGGELLTIRTIVSLIQKDVIKCANLHAKEKNVQVALGTMEPNAMYLTLNREADVIKKCVKLRDFLR